jgi:8-oxo-dGTP diphosphatase
MQRKPAKTLDIAVGVLVDAAGCLLIAQRRPGTVGAGHWEFPGGKRKPGEPIARTLALELAEELGIGDCRAEPVIRFVHHYGPHPVRLHVSQVHAWSGQAYGREGQRLCWVEHDQLTAVDLLPAGDVIVNALGLSRRYLITPAVAPLGKSAWLAGLQCALDHGIRLLRLRDHALDDTDYAAIAARAIARARAAGARVLLDRDPTMAARLGADGLHWSCARLLACGRPGSALLLAVSAHSGEELAQATAAGADFATLSPVAATPSHPGVQPLGWLGWAAQRAEHALPVYALGGLGEADIAQARQANAQGVAAIRGFWPELEKEKFASNSSLHKN